MHVAYTRGYYDLSFVPIFVGCKLYLTYKIRG